MRHRGLRGAKVVRLVVRRFAFVSGSVTIVSWWMRPVVSPDLSVTGFPCMPPRWTARLVFELWGLYPWVCKGYARCRLVVDIDPDTCRERTSRDLELEFVLKIAFCSTHRDNKICSG